MDPIILVVRSVISTGAAGGMERSIQNRFLHFRPPRCPAVHLGRA